MFPHFAHCLSRLFHRRRRRRRRCRRRRRRCRRRCRCRRRRRRRRRRYRRRHRRHRRRRRYRRCRIRNLDISLSNCAILPVVGYFDPSSMDVSYANSKNIVVVNDEVRTSLPLFFSSLTSYLSYSFDDRYTLLEYE